MTSYKKYLDLEVFEGDISSHEFPYHFHQCYTIVFVELGSVSYQFQRENVEVSKDDILIIAPLESHKNVIKRRTKYKAIFIPEYYFDFYSHEKISSQIISGSRLIQVLQIFIRNFNESTERGEVKRNVKRICRMINQPLKLQASEGVSIKNSPLNFSGNSRKMEYDSNIDSLSHHAHLSKFHFQRKFKKINGLTVNQYKQQQKTLEARALLEQGVKSTEVAHRLGFFDQSHFIKYFKKMWILPPKYI